MQHIRTNFLKWIIPFASTFTGVPALAAAFDINELVHKKIGIANSFKNEFTVMQTRVLFEDRFEKKLPLAGVEEVINREAREMLKRCGIETVEIRAERLASYRKPDPPAPESPYATHIAPVPDAFDYAALRKDMGLDTLFLIRPFLSKGGPNGDHPAIGLRVLQEGLGYSKASYLTLSLSVSAFDTLSTDEILRAKGSQAVDQPLSAWIRKEDVQIPDFAINATQAGLTRVAREAYLQAFESAFGERPCLRW